MSINKKNLCSFVMTNGNFIKYLLILGTMKSKSLSANIGTIYMETFEQKYLSPEGSGSEVIQGKGQ